MTFVITSACVDVVDQSCIEVCPVDCILVEDIDRMCYIEPNDCIDCAVCESGLPRRRDFLGTPTSPETTQEI